jgi:rod shape-determining protein MreC
VILTVVVLIASGSVVGGLRRAGRDVVSPFAWVLREAARPVADLVSGAVNYSSVVAQNHQLREELARLRLAAGENQALRRQLAEITAVDHLPFVGRLHGVIAQVTANSVTNFSSSFTIDEGRLDGVLVGMPVVGSGGLVGRVAATDDHSATVVAITDPTSSVGCTFGSGRIDVLVDGRGVNSPLAVNQVPLVQPLNVGVLLSTNGLEGGAFPPGLPVARVTTVTSSPGSSTYDLTVTPVADLHQLSYVEVLLWEPTS